MVAIAKSRKTLTKIQSSVFLTTFAKRSLCTIFFGVTCEGSIEFPHET